MAIFMTFSQNQPVQKINGSHPGWGTMNGILDTKFANFVANGITDGTRKTGGGSAEKPSLLTWNKTHGKSSRDEKNSSTGGKHTNEKHTNGKGTNSIQRVDECCFTEQITLKFSIGDGLTLVKPMVFGSNQNKIEEVT